MSLPEDATFRDLCLRCRRPRVVCWCGAVTQVPSATRVVFVQHPREARVPVSTCRMAHLSLPNSELHIALGAAGNARLEEVAATPGAMLLFPSDTATDVDALDTPPSLLVVVDGTWSNARKVAEKCPLLSKLPRIRFSPEAPGNYRIRKEPAEHCLATIEAVAHVLERLEKAPGRFKPILSAFDHMVDRQLEYVERTGNRSRHSRKDAARARRVDPLDALREAKGRLVAVFGEANAWPMDREDRPEGDAELVQLVARRQEDASEFQALLRPARALSPSVGFHLDVPVGAFDAAAPRADALAAFDVYLKDDDVLVGWGGFCRDLLATEGRTAHAFLDARGLLAQRFGGRLGSVEACAERLGVPLPEGQGRAARRLLALSAVIDVLLCGDAERLRPVSSRAAPPAPSATVRPCT